MCIRRRRIVVAAAAGDCSAAHSFGVAAGFAENRKWPTFDVLVVLVVQATDDDPLAVATDRLRAAGSQHCFDSAAAAAAAAGDRCGFAENRTLSPFDVLVDANPRGVAMNGRRTGQHGFESCCGAAV